MHPKRLDLELISTFDELDRAVEALQEFVPSLNLEDDLSYRVILLASEALTNALEHGNGWDKSKKATLSLVRAESQIELCVTDEGEGIHWAQRDPLADVNVLDERGRGQYFMKQMADEVYIEEDGCSLRLIFYCSRESAA